MEPLEDADLRQLLAAIEQLDFDCDLTRFPDQAIAAAATIVQFDMASCNEYRGQTRFMAPDLSLSSAGYRIVSVIHRTPGLLVALELNRRHTDFSSTDRAKLEVLRRHLSGHYVLAMLLTGMEPHDDFDHGIGPLTPQEAVVLNWVRLGKTNCEVAAIVGSSPLTVKKHLEHIYQKLGVANRTAAAQALISDHRQVGPHPR